MRWSWSRTGTLGNSSPHSFHICQPTTSLSDVEDTSKQAQGYRDCWVQRDRPAWLDESLDLQSHHQRGALPVSLQRNSRPLLVSKSPRWPDKSRPSTWTPRTWTASRLKAAPPKLGQIKSQESISLVAAGVSLGVI